MTTFNKPPSSAQYKPLDPKSVHFSIFSSEEIKELSVLKVSTPLSFDALGHPLKGGLYDPVLGPVNERSDPCGTCHRTIATCPGHFGHIELPVLVVNPLFHKTIFTILSSSCIECYRLQIDDQTKNLLNLKINLIESGHLTDALDIDSLVSNLLKSNPKTPDDAISFDIMENKMVKKYVKLLKKKTPHMELFLNKNVYKLKDKFINEAFKKKPAKRCMYCSQPLIKITSIANKLMCVIGDPHNKNAVKRNTMLMPDRTCEIMRKIWAEDKLMLKQLIPVLKTMKIAEPTDIFFLNIIPVPPLIVRPCNFLQGQIIEHPQVQVYKSIMKTSFVVRAIIQAAQIEMRDEDSADISTQAKLVVESTPGATPLEKLQNAWRELQTTVDFLINSDNSKTGEQGLKQIIEKKEGLIRLHMMGKRVNYAARSVITPDPNLSIEEIGVPEAFAIKLTYPVPVTSWNVEELRRMVINGPNKHPGAVTIENEDGRVVSIPGWSSDKRESLAMRLLTPDENKVTGVKIVNRHLSNGDVMLLNRQPTLHKPSIMAHRARVLKGEKTLRLHYANCKAYNADFDGDEMNAHFPQNEIARSEAYNIMSVNRQYLVPKDGTPLSGLIQDHVISGVKLSIRGRFFSKADYQQLVYQGLSHLKKNIKLLPPAIIKPVELWSGKQILSTLIINIVPPNKSPVTLIGTAKISSKAWETEPARHWVVGGTQFPNINTMTESEVIIRHGELLSGVLDKSHFGATQYGLVHCVYELYGGDASGVLLSSLAKLFMIFLQWEGFTLGVKDILVIPKADTIRSMLVKNCRTIGNATSAEAVDLPPDTDYKFLISTLENVSSKNAKFRAIIDRKYKSALDKYTNDINKTCLPSGLLSQFPSNNLQLMVQSGAKGSTVNTMQISCLLGQIELEGKRPPLMVSGRSLPSFPPFETSPRAGGFIDGRFMTGIQPQEFFFHCMAGREGLIDTAVKTSKSGYLQRCLIKHLEGITINYDMTVRDSDDSIIQFAYGEDGMDVCKATFYNNKQLKFLDQNTEAIVDNDILKHLEEDYDSNMVNKYGKSIKKWIKRHPNPKMRRSPFLQFSKFVTECDNLNEFCKKYPGRNELACKVIDAWNSADSDVKEGYKTKDCTKCPDPLVSKFQPDHYFGIINEKMEQLIDDYLKRRHHSIDIDKFTSDASDFKDMMKIKLMESLAAPGEPVGLLAAQSIGEPSTQMTLNTFHFAGRGEMNVTLGIPRLREILMMASSNLKTPSMDIPFKTHLKNVTKSAERLQRKLCRVTVEHVLEKIDVESELKLVPNREFSFTLNFKFLPHSNYKDKCNVTPKQIIKYMEKHFFSLLFKDIFKAAGKRSGMMVGAQGEEKEKRTRKDGDDDPDFEVEKPTKKGVFTEDVESSDEEVQNEDDDTTQVRNRKRHTECQEYEDPESEEEERSDVEDAAADKTADMEDEGFEDFNAKPDEHSLQVLTNYSQATDYSHDKEEFRWCQLIFSLPLSVSKIDLSAILRRLAERCVIYEVPRIKRAITYLNNSSEIVLKTEGININEMFQYNEVLNLDKLYSNDIHAMANTYGIEAAGKVIIKEIQNVFNVYGIHVDLRHLSLISDYMTYNGVFEPMSRKGMESSISPLQQMSFESSLTFLKDAAIKGKIDLLKSASSCLMLGQPCKSGTGAFSLYNSL